jgi:hypothetical protein
MHVASFTAQGSQFPPYSSFSSWSLAQVLETPSLLPLGTPGQAQLQQQPLQGACLNLLA